MFLNTKIIRGVTFMMTSIVLSTAGHAITLGDLRGSAVLGQPLDVSVWVDAGNGERISKECFSAQLQFGDFPQTSLTLQLPKTEADATSATWVRIKSAAVVDEPVVTIVLRATCGATTSRRYVLLSDFPATDVPSTSPMAAVKSAGGAAASPKTLSPVVTDLPPALAASRGATAKPSKATGLSRSKASKGAVAGESRKKKGSPALHLVNPVPFQMVAGTEPDNGNLVLKLDSEMIILNPGELASTAAGRVSLPTLESGGSDLKPSMQLETLQKDLDAAKALNVKNQATVAGLEAKLRQAEAERVPTMWLYLLAGLLALALAVLAWVLRRQQNAKEAWWHQAEAGATEMLGPLASSAEQAPVTMLDPSLAPPGHDTARVDLDFNLDSLSAIEMHPTPPQEVVLPEPESEPEPLNGTCNLNSELVSDVRQQAEFFVSLGQTVRAIDLLHRHIQKSTEHHPQVYLDLLTLYHSQGMKFDFRELRTDFSRHFNGEIPDFPAFYHEGRDLLDYPELLVELVRAWPTGGASAFLNGCIFRGNSSAPRVTFDLAAFRDLLLLSTIADQSKAAAHSPHAVPASPQAHPIDPTDLPGLDVSSYASNPETVPAIHFETTIATPSSWFAPAPPVPTTDELNMEYSIDMLKTTGTPKKP